MIFWDEYKKHKATAIRVINEGSKKDEVQIEVLKYKLNEQTYEQTVENIINILSGYEHFKPL